MWWMWLGLAMAQAPDDVAEGWYLWSTGQDEQAYALADELADGPLRGDVLPFVVAMQVDRSDGASLEADLRHAWARSPDDPWARTALAWGLALRHGSEGPWCDEVEVLLGKVTSGEAAYWAALADRQRSLRCDGSAEHGEAQLRRLARDGEVATYDATLGTLRAKYYKEGFGNEVEAMWAAEPHRLRFAGYAWQEGVAGPAKMAVRKVTNKALQEAAEGDVPALVHAAMLGYRDAGKDKAAEEARERLVALDPAADPALERSLDDVVDPPIYGTIAACVTEARVVEEATACLDKLTVPEQGSVAASYHAARRDVFDVAKGRDRAYEAARAAWQADPSHRFHARVFADRALERGEDGELAVQAATVVLEGWVPEDPGVAPEATRNQAAAHLLRLAKAELAVDDAEAAVAHLETAVALSTDPELPYWLGMALSAAEAPDEAVIALAYALVEPIDDLGLVGDARRALDEALGDWHPGGVKGALSEVRRPLGDEAPAHPSVGDAMPEGLLPEVADDLVVEARVVLVVAPWREASAQALERASAIGERYAARGVQMFVLQVGASAVELEEGIELEALQGDASTLRALRLLAVPSVVVADGKGRIRDVLVGYDSGSIDLEEALDAFLPPEADE